MVERGGARSAPPTARAQLAHLGVGGLPFVACAALILISSMSDRRLRKGQQFAHAMVTHRSVLSKPKMPSLRERRNLFVGYRTG